jgi:ubiquinone biosynthesis accessory factor UbiJ
MQAHPYNRRAMLQSLQALFVPAVFERLVLVVNHVLAAEPVATAKLVPHQGRLIALELQQWPAWLPAPPVLKVGITPAGLLEWCGLDDAVPPDLSVQVNAANPAALFARALVGEPPPLHVAGHAVLASDIQWLVDNLRWDVEADRERVFGPVVAHQVARLGSSLAAGLRGLARTPWMRPRSEADPRGPSPRA